MLKEASLQEKERKGEKRKGRSKKCPKGRGATQNFAWHFSDCQVLQKLTVIFTFRPSDDNSDSEGEESRTRRKGLTKCPLNNLEKLLNCVCHVCTITYMRDIIVTIIIIIFSLFVDDMSCAHESWSYIHRVKKVGSGWLQELQYIMPLGSFVMEGNHFLGLVSYSQVQLVVWKVWSIFEIREPFRNIERYPQIEEFETSLSDQVKRS